MTSSPVRADTMGAAGGGYFEDLYQHAPCGYLTCDDDGFVTRVNETFLRWCGYDRDEVEGAALKTLMPVGDQILFTTHCLPQLRTSGTLSEALVEIVAADRTRRPVLISATRRPTTAARPAEIRFIIFSAHQRREYEHELINALRRAEESEARRFKAEADARHMALHDALTGLPNRAGLTALLANDHLASGLRCLLYIDLDHFKSVNDSLGHAAGDELLVVVADRLRSVTRSSEIVARLSGDEFVVTGLVDGPEEAHDMAQRLLDALVQPVVIQELEIALSASIGGSVQVRSDHPTEHLLRRADAAMYRAKATGGNRVAFHDPTRADPAVDRLRLIGELRHGIQHDQLRLLYQPRVALPDGELTGVEALVRWEHPARGLLAPAEFIPVAEQSGLIRPLGCWVLNEAVTQLVEWTRDMPTCAPKEISVNISARQLSDPKLVGVVSQALFSSGLDASRLILEITETALIEHPDIALASLRSLKTLGVQLAVDDFGTGYASLTYLQQFPLDELKIDRSFVAGLDADTSSDRAIVSTCVQLAKAIGIRAVAEGVETEAQRQTLIEYGCGLAQGHSFAPPLSSAELTTWAHQRTTRSSAD